MLGNGDRSAPSRPASHSSVNISKAKPRTAPHCIAPAPHGKILQQDNRAALTVSFSSFQSHHPTEPHDTKGKKFIAVRFGVVKPLRSLES